MRQVGAEAQITVWRQKRRSSGCENAQSWDVSNVSGKPCFESFFAHGVEDLPLFLINTVSATGIGIKEVFAPLQDRGPQQLGRELRCERSQVELCSTPWCPRQTTMAGPSL